MDEYTFSEVFGFFAEQFFSLFIAVLRKLSGFVPFWLMVCALVVYAVVCLVWSLILDD